MQTSFNHKIINNKKIFRPIHESNIKHGCLYFNLCFNIHGEAYDIFLWSILFEFLHMLKVIIKSQWTVALGVERKSLWNFFVLIYHYIHHFFHDHFNMLNSFMYLLKYWCLCICLRSIEDPPLALVSVLTKWKKEVNKTCRNQSV